MIKTIKLGKLVTSPRNVRRSSDEQADAQLKADIEARGLLQNLVVSAVAKPRGSFAVEAGGRRLRALQQLLSEGKLERDHEVCCLVIEDGDDAHEASLAENFQRLSMNPADECLAFKALIEQGADVEGVARRFGLTTRFVEGRLRLAALAPAIFEALGSGEISLDLAKAYAASADHERQLYVFEQMSRGYGGAHPDSVRRMMTQASVSANDRRARFVGEDLYVEAGGRVERDLFSDAAEARWLDVALLERLAFEKLEQFAAQKQAETGLAFVRPTLERWLGSADLEGLKRVPLEASPLTDEETATVEALEAEAEGLAELIDDEEADEQDRADAETKIAELHARIEAIVSKPPEIDEGLKPRIGAFLMLDEAGQPKLDCSFYTDFSAELGVISGAGSETEAAVGDRGNANAKPGLSQRLVDELAMQRRDILAVHLAADPALSLDLAIFVMVDRDAGYCAERTGSSLSASPPSNPVFDLKTPDAKATIAAIEADGALDRSWHGGKSRAERFDAFRLLPDEARAAWLGHAMAKSLEASLNLPGQRFFAFQEHLGRLLEIDVARWWRPTGANFFDRVSKSVALDALAEIGGPELAARYAKARKAELSEACERIFAGDFLADPGVKAAALNWLPDAMRFAEPASASGAAEPESEAVDPDVEVEADAEPDAGSGSQDELVDESEDVF